MTLYIQSYQILLIPRKILSPQKIPFFNFYGLSFTNNILKQIGREGGWAFQKKEIYFFKGRSGDLKLTKLIRKSNYESKVVVYVKGCLKKMSRFVFFNFSGLEKAAVLNDTFLKCILKELSKTVFKSFLRQFSREIW